MYGKTCSGCGKTNHLKGVCISTRGVRHTYTDKSTPKQGSEWNLGRHIHRWSMIRALEKGMRIIDSVTIKSFSINSLRSVALTKSEISSKHTKCQIAYKVDTGNDSNLIPVDLLRKLFPNTTKEQLSEYGNRCVVLYTYNQSSIIRN